MTKKNSRYIFIFNPAADKGRASRKAEWLRSLLSERSDSALFTTSYAGHAGDIACSEAKEGTCMIACGGDGTLHEVVNAVAEQGVTVGIVPIGSANDFIKTRHPQRSVHSVFTSLFDQQSKAVDLGSVAYGNASHRYFINSLGIGFTGRIAKSVQESPWLKGEIGYVYALLSVLFGYEPLTMAIKITLEDSIIELHEPIFVFSVLNGKVEGGKFMIAPDAELADGLLDVCILRAVPKYQFFRYVLHYLRGTHINDSQVLYCKARRVEVTLDAADVMHLDGELYDDISGTVVISVVPQGLSVQ